jgi:hypothetical protein
LHERCQRGSHPSVVSLLGSSSVRVSEVFEARSIPVTPQQTIYSRKQRRGALRGAPRASPARVTANREGARNQGRGCSVCLRWSAVLLLSHESGSASWLGCWLVSRIRVRWRRGTNRAADVIFRRRTDRTAASPRRSRWRQTPARRLARLMHFLRFGPFGNFFLHFLIAAARLKAGGAMAGGERTLTTVEPWLGSWVRSPP